MKKWNELKNLSIALLGAYAYNNSIVDGVGLLAQIIAVFGMFVYVLVLVKSVDRAIRRKQVKRNV